MLSEAVRKTFLGLVEADKARRTPAELSHLCLGLKCGGSDGFSGLSANPAIGHTSDLLVALGGRAMLSEFPELCGVEQNLINRSVSRGFRPLRSTDARLSGKSQSGRLGFRDESSPGNIRDGTITDAMKSAGCPKKAADSPVTRYSTIRNIRPNRDCNLQCTPGNDVECVTAQVGRRREHRALHDRPRDAGREPDRAGGKALHEFGAGGDE